MAYKKGADVLIKVFNTDSNEYIAVAGQQGASFSRTSDSFSYNVKGDNWTYNEATYRAWQVTCDGLYVINDAGFKALEDAFINGDTVKVQISFDNTSAWEGDAIISDFSVEMPQDNMVSYSITLLGKGEIAQEELAP